MFILKQIVYGAVQGITEFLPISSSGHLVILHEFWPLNSDNSLAFDVMLHSASLLAVVLFFYQDIFRIISGFFSACKKKEFFGSEFKIPLSIVISTIPAAIAGLFLGGFIEDSLRSVYVVVLMLAAVGIYLLVSDRQKLGKGMADISYLSALLIGLAQVLALVPGTSRSGITIATALFLGFYRPEAIKYSFLISIPVVLGATILELPALDFSFFLSNWPAFASTFLAAYFSIRWLLRFAQKNSFKAFSYYRFALAGLILALLLL